MSNNKKINYKSERVFPLMFVIIGFTLMISGIIIWIKDSKLLTGFSLMLIGIVFVNTRRGTIIDFGEEKIKQYIGLFFIKLGKWETLNELPYISVLPLNLKSGSESVSGLRLEDKMKVYRICLLNNTHHTRIKVKDYAKLENAVSVAKEIAIDLKKDYVLYNPK